MNVLNQSTPLLALISRRQCVQVYKSRTCQSSIHLFSSSTASIPPTTRITRRNASTQTARKPSPHEEDAASSSGTASIIPESKATYNSASSITATEASTEPASSSLTPPPAAILSTIQASPSTGYDEAASPLSRILAPTQPNAPFILDPHLNPPSSTRPPSLDVPIRQPEQTAIGYYIKLGRAYLSFYKRGLQAINVARKEAKLIRARVREHELQHIKMMKENPEKAKEAMSSTTAPWTRAEFQLLRRSRHDMTRLPIFGLLFLICGEFTPLVMLAAKSKITPLLPYTVRLPSQVEGERKQVVAKRAAVEKKWEESGIDKDSSIDTFARYGAEYFNLGPVLWPLAWQPSYMVLRHTRVYYEYLLYDDVLLGRNGVEKLMDEEVVTSCLERGLWDEESEIGELRERLQKSVRRSLQPIDKKRSIYDR